MTISGSNCGFGDASRLYFKANDIQTSNKSWKRLLQFTIVQFNIVQDKGYLFLMMGLVNFEIKIQP